MGIDAGGEPDAERGGGEQLRSLGGERGLVSARQCVGESGAEAGPFDVASLCP